MKFVSPVLKRLVYPCLSRSGYLRHRAATGGLSVVTYHGVLPMGYRVSDPNLDGNLVSTESLRRQIRLLKSHYNVITPEQVFLWSENKQELPPRAVLVTCDDGLLNNLTDMLPVLQDEKVSCLFFVTGAALDNKPQMLWHEELYLMLMAAREGFFTVSVDSTRFESCLGSFEQRNSQWWMLVKRLSQCDRATRQEFLRATREELGFREEWKSAYLDDPVLRRRFLMLGVPELKQLVAAGVSIAAHTLTHPILSQLSTELAYHEIAASRRRLEEALGIEVCALAYPFGDPESLTTRELELAERAGYRCAFVNFGGGFGADMPRFAIPRVNINSDMGLGEFEANISGFYRGMRQRFYGAEHISRSGLPGCLQQERNEIVQESGEGFGHLGFSKKSRARQVEEHCS